MLITENHDDRTDPERQRRSLRGQAETIGVVLVLAMTLIAATVAIAFGAAGLDVARLDAQEGGVEHALTQLDSRSAMVALGDSDSQQVQLAASGQGSYRIDSDAGWIKVIHSNYDGEGNDTTLYNESLGALVYERDDKRVAYQGGGVWQTEGANSTMVSPPEFHYHSATLTLPVIRVDGDTSVGGAGVMASIARETSAKRVYPNESATYPETGENYSNPVHDGNVTVTVKSDYYLAWADYFEQRTSGTVTVDHANETASVKLISFGTSGDFEMPAEGNDIELRGLGDGHPLEEFTITLRPDDTDSADFADLKWSLYAEQGSQQFEIHLRETGKNGTLSTADCTVRDVGATVYYTDSNGDPYHGWHDPVAFNTDCKDFNGDGEGQAYLEADLVGASQLTMQQLSSSHLLHYSTSGDTLQDPVHFTEHEGEYNADWEPKEFNTTTGFDETTIGNLTNHYLALMGPDVDLTVSDKSGGTVNEGASTGQLEQSGGSGQFVTFLHITENRVRIELD
jgi:flagellin-like protein